MNKNFYLTTPIYYVNDKPHIGHAYTSLATDVIARFKRLDGFNVRFLTGTDEHGQKVEKSAKLKNIDPQEFTDQVSESFRDLVKKMNFSPDDFIRTTEARHKKSASHFWQILEKNGYIYKGKYSGWYSVRDEAFYSDSELVEGKAPTGADVEWTEEETYFFKLSAFQDKLLKFYEENPDFIAPNSRKNEVVTFVRGGKKYKKGALQDLSISRTSFSWGVSVPNDPSHVIYVWLDALTNYLSSLGFPEEQKEFKNFWPADLHIVGKDILRFHAVYWPAFLMAANIEVPKRIFAHGWWTNEGEKISKSVGNVIDPIELIDKFGLDYVRYFLLKYTKFGSDGNYSDTELIRLCNSDLANNIGNLTSRVVSFTIKNCEGKIPTDKKLDQDDKKLIDEAYQLIDNLRKFIDVQDFGSYLEEVIKLSSKANEYVDKKAPWALKKTDIEQMEASLYVLLELIKIIAYYLQAFMPDSMAKILAIFNISGKSQNFSELNEGNKLQSGSSLNETKAIFPRL